MTSDDFRTVFRDAGFIVPYLDRELSADESERLQFASGLGVPTLRAVNALCNIGIHPCKVDQLDEIVRLCKLMKVSAEKVAACFGYIDGKHLFEGSKSDPVRLLYPSTTRGLALFQMFVGTQMVPANVKLSPTAMSMLRQGVSI